MSPWLINLCIDRVMKELEVVVVEKWKTDGEWKSGGYPACFREMI